MRNVSWSLASMVIVAMVVIGTVALLDRDVAAVSSAILTLLVALGLAELREIKSNTNGSNNSLLEQNKALMHELAQYRRDALRITDRAFESAPMGPPPHQGSTPPSQSQSSTQQYLTTTTTTFPQDQ